MSRKRVVSNVYIRSHTHAEGVKIDKHEHRDILVVRKFDPRRRRRSTGREDKKKSRRKNEVDLDKKRSQRRRKRRNKNR